MMHRVCQVARIQKSSGWLYLGFLANRALGIIALTLAVLDMRFESVDLPFEAYAMAILFAIVLGWLEKEKQHERCKSIGGRIGIETTGGTLKLSNTQIKGVKIALRSKGTKSAFHNPS